MDHDQHHQGVSERTEHLAEAVGATPPGGHESHAAGGHNKHAGHSVAMFRDKFWLSLALTIPVVLLSHDIQEWVSCPRPSAGR